MGALAYLCSLKDQRSRAFGLGGREQHRERPTFGFAHHRRLLAADSVHDGANVVHALFQGRRPRNPIGHAHSAHVEEDEPRELCKPLTVAAECRQLPVDLEVGVRALRVDEIDGPLADDAVGDVDLAAAREPHTVTRDRVTRDGAGVNPSAGGERLAHHEVQWRWRDDV